MVRTRADAGSARVSAAKASRKTTSGASGSCSSPAGKGGSSKDRSGGNSYNPQPVPSWQKGISAFMKPAPAAHSSETSQEVNSGDLAGGSTSNSDCGGSSSCSSSSRDSI